MGLGHNIFTEAENWQEVQLMLRDAVHCHFDAAQLPRLININFVQDEIIEVREPITPVQVFNPP